MEAMDEETWVDEGGGDDSEGEDDIFSILDSDSHDDELLNEDIWDQIKCNDPNITTMTVSSLTDGTINWEKEGHYLGTNTNVKTLTFTSVNVKKERYHGKDYDAEGKKHIIDFCKGVSYNKSINHLVLANNVLGAGSAFPNIWPLFDNNCSLRCSSLEQVTICQNRIRDESALAKLISSLKFYSGITKLSLTSNVFAWRRRGEGVFGKIGNMLSGRGREEGLFGKIGCTALGNLLQNPTCNISSLNLGESKINDKGLSVLSHMLLDNNSLKKLCLSSNAYITSKGWKAFSAFLRSLTSSLEVLDLKNNDIDDQGADALASALANNTTLRSLNLCHNGNIDNRGWRAVASVLSSPQSALKRLYLNNNEMDDEILAALGGGLTNNRILKHLDLSYNSGISPNGWRVFFNSLQNSICAVENIDLGGNIIDDDGAVALAASLGSMRSLKTLNLEANWDISTEGWQAISNHLQNPNSLLRKLCLTGIGFRDEEINAFANALIHNRSLRVLIFDMYEVRATTVWAAFSNALCDSSSIDATISSNHILQRLCETYEESRMSRELLYLLHLNRDNARTESVRKKILDCHFLNYGDINVEELIGMDFNVLPTAISWIGRDHVGFPVLYQLLRSMPSLFDN